MDCVKLLILTISLIPNILEHVNGDTIVDITGGATIPINAAPFMASLVRYFTVSNGDMHYYVCGGSIIHERFILTAAHCVEDKTEEDVIRVGSSQLLKGGKTYTIEKMIAHENYSTDEVDFMFDVALVKLKEPLEFGPTISKVILADDGVGIKPGTVVNITGWGRTGVKGPISQNLRQVTLKIKSNENCLVYPWTSSEEICVWSYKKGSCKGDSGGPMTKGNVQVGIVSNGLACGFLPSVFAKVSFLLPWIKKTMNESL